MFNYKEYPHFLVLSGSRLYGYATADSDYDYLGFIVPEFEQLVGMCDYFEIYKASQLEIDSGIDYKVYSIRKFIDSLIRNDTQCLEILFAPKENYTITSWVSDIIMQNRDLFLSKQIYKRFVGYAYSEFRKVRGVGIEYGKVTPKEKDVVNTISNVFSPNKETMDKITELLYKDKPKREVNVYRKLGKARKETIDKYGFSIKNAANCIRLLAEGIYILKNCTLKMPLDNELQKTIVKIRNGQMKYEEVESIYNDLIEEIKTAHDKSELQNTVNIKKINELLLNIYKEKYF